MTVCWITTRGIDGCGCRLCRRARAGFYWLGMLGFALAAPCAFQYAATWAMDVAGDLSEYENRFLPCPYGTGPGNIVATVIEQRLLNR